MKDNLNAETLKIYGFGSFFRGAKEFNDLDFLILHQTTTKYSCQAAIECKRIILNEIKNSHISMLSIKEEESIGFIKKSRAYLLGEVNISNMKTELVNILNKAVSHTII
ncbi:hypothetical protein [Acinetobacter johnsonii]|uniref:hypothetical protein n=1 Tax=Acinetobacter johnsonii TaxID=40214 RepID=UPI001F360DC3|nr:hypothetical protein [Acinetobacter johnsonii]UJA02498.1 hypothetical protein GBN93_16940 [Acinetobacter johnsonii]